MAKLFGTDGPRGIAVTDLTCELAMQTGRAAAAVLAKKGGKTRILVGKDTRRSSDALEAAVCAGICSVGADVELLGIVPTPAVTHLIGTHEADGGIMISGSHNSAEFNGLKIFCGRGHKIMEEAEEEIERLVLYAPQEMKPCSNENMGRMIHSEKTAASEYIEHIKAAAEIDLSGFRIAIDCANGCAAFTAKKLFTSLGAKVFVMFDKPDGTNINRDCGSTNIQHIMEFVVKNGCDCGLAFDGDADRCIAVDEKGAMVDGDRQLAIFARSMKEQGLLDKDTAVITAMSGLGLRKYAAENGIKLVSSGAGVRYVLERMLEGGYKLGGEPNGHIIFLGDSGTGDGQLAGVRLMSIMKRSGMKLSQLAEDIPAYPQVKLNVKISPHFKELWKNEKSVTELIESFEKELGSDGRIMVRESGKEPIVRIMAEGNDFGRINEMAVEIAQHIKGKCSAGE